MKLNTVLFNKGLLEISGVYNVGQEFLGQNVRFGPGSIVRGGLTGSTNHGYMANVHFDYPLGKHWVGGHSTIHLRGTREPSGARWERERIFNAFLGLFNSQYSGFGVSRYTEGGGLELITLGQMNDSTGRPQQRVSLTLTLEVAITAASWR